MNLTACALSRSAAIAVAILCFTTASADSAVPSTSIEANTSFWWILDEQVENGLVQPGSGDAADDDASGFNFKQGRLAFSLLSPGGSYEAFLRIRLEERTDVIDFWGAYHPTRRLCLYIGQMKIPSTAEVLTADHKIDFITRSVFGQNVGDFAMSRTPYISSVMAAKSYDRDLGIAFKGSLPLGSGRTAGWFLMVANGIGANKYIGGGESEEFIYTNEFGDYYYGLRLELTPLKGIDLGAHASFNRHHDIALGSRGPVFDIDRRVWTSDLSAKLPWNQRLGAFYGAGSMEDYWESTGYRFDYSGWGIWTLQPLFGERIELGLRFDSFTTEFNLDGNDTTQNDWTFGINYMPDRYLRIQLNYTMKDSVNEFEPDLDDDILYMNLQFLFDAAISE